MLGCKKCKGMPLLKTRSWKALLYFIKHIVCLELRLSWSCSFKSCLLKVLSKKSYQDGEVPVGSSTNSNSITWLSLGLYFIALQLHPVTIYIIQAFVNILAACCKRHIWVHSCEVSGWICALPPLLSEEWSCLSAVLQVQDKTLISSSFSLLWSLCPLLFPPGSSHLLVLWHLFQAVLRLSNNLVQLQSGPFLSCSAVTAAHENGETHSRGSGINISLAEGKPSPP